MQLKNLLLIKKEITDQTHTLEHIREFYEILFKTWKQKTDIGMDFFSVMLIFQNSLKIRQNFVRKI